jgi:hypothetical protein
MVVAALLIAAALLPTAGDAVPPARRADCGKIASTSIYPRAKVVVLRGVACGKARRVARHFDRSGEIAFGHWRCGLAHGGGRRLFSCGWPQRSGDIAKWRHALVAYGAGKPR